MKSKSCTAPDCTESTIWNGAFPLYHRGFSLLSVLLDLYTYYLSWQIFPPRPPCILRSILKNHFFKYSFKAVLPPKQRVWEFPASEVSENPQGGIFRKRACVNGLIFAGKSGVYRHRLCLLSTVRTAVSLNTFSKTFFQNGMLLRGIAGFNGLLKPDFPFIPLAEFIENRFFKEMDCR